MNKKLTVLSVLVLAVAMTAYSVAGTYAKYTTTSSERSDSARVAKWKINDITTIDLFGDSYLVGGAQKTGDETNTIVVSDDEVNVVAPGTHGSYTFAITGTSETNYTINVAATVNDNIGQIVYHLDGGDALTATQLQTALSNLGKDGENAIVYGPTSLTNDSHSHTITWEWVYEKTTGEPGEEVVDTVNDGTDTGLGNTAVTGTAAQVSISVQVTATQSSLASTYVAPAIP